MRADGSNVLGGSDGTTADREGGSGNQGEHAAAERRGKQGFHERISSIGRIARCAVCAGRVNAVFPLCKVV
jgi:hypothetical protein